MLLLGLVAGSGLHEWGPCCLRSCFLCEAAMRRAELAELHSVQAEQLGVRCFMIDDRVERFLKLAPE